MGYQEFHQFPAEEKLAVFNTISQEYGLPDFAVEKDWWVVRVLDIIFQTEIAEHTVFKGGTSLSKAWGLIERFSEDVDLALDRSFLGFNLESPSRTQVGKLRKASKTYIVQSLVPQIQKGFLASDFNEVKVKAIETGESDQDPLLIEVNYPNITQATEYVLPRVLVEIGSRSLREPFSPREIQSLIGTRFSDMHWADSSINIPSVNPERTVLEKLFLLHEEFQRPKEKMRVERLSRHLYDIHQISQTEFIEKAVSDPELYKAIVIHRSVFAKLGGVDYDSHFPPNLNPVPPKAILEDWRTDYATMQEQMIYGKSLPFDELINSIEGITKRINGQ